MTRYEYKVVPAPRKGTKTKEAKSSDAKLAVSVEEVMNEMGSQGWYYLRSDTLPIEERSGLTGKNTTFQHLLVFVRELQDEPKVETTSEPVISATPPAVEVEVIEETADEAEASSAEDPESKA